MTVKETRAFMEEIKAFYPEFSIEDYLISQWSSQLKDCSLLEAKDYFENHKIGSMKEKAPNLKFFVYCFNNSKNKKPGQFQCKYCKSTFKDLEEMHKCERLCRTKKYIYKVSNILEINIAEVFGTTDLTKDVIDKMYKRFMYKVFVRQRETGLLDEKTTEGVMLYYRQVLEPELKKAGKL